MNLGTAGWDLVKPFDPDMPMETKSVYVPCPRCGGIATVTLTRDIRDPFFGYTDEHVTMAHAACNCGATAAAVLMKDPEIP